MSVAIDVAAIADRFGLGAHAIADGAPERGELGEVWRVRTDAGTWAVKRCFAPLREADAAQIARFHDAAIANGVRGRVVLLHRSCRLWLAPATSAQGRAQRAAEVDEWIRDPCTRTAVEFLLDAIRG